MSAESRKRPNNGAKRKYDPQPGEVFFGQLIVAASERDGEWLCGERWMLVQCPKCHLPREVNIYRIVYGKARQCQACARAVSRAAVRPRRRAS